MVKHTFHGKRFSVKRVKRQIRRIALGGSILRNIIVPMFPRPRERHLTQLSVSKRLSKVCFEKVTIMNHMHKNSWNKLRMQFGEYFFFRASHLRIEILSQELGKG